MLTILYVGCSENFLYGGGVFCTTCVVWYIINHDYINVVLRTLSPWMGWMIVVADQAHIFEYSKQDERI